MSKQVKYISGYQAYNKDYDNENNFAVVGSIKLIAPRKAHIMSLLTTAILINGKYQHLLAFENNRSVVFKIRLVDI